MGIGEIIKGISEQDQHGDWSLGIEIALVLTMTYAVSEKKAKSKEHECDKNILLTSLNQKNIKLLLIGPKIERFFWVAISSEWSKYMCIRGVNWLRT